MKIDETISVLNKVKKDIKVIPGKYDFNDTCIIYHDFQNVIKYLEYYKQRKE